MRKYSIAILLVVFVFVVTIGGSLTSCRTGRTVTTIVADSVSAHTATATTAHTVADSGAHSESTATVANVVEHVVTTTVLYDTAGRVTATTTTTTDRTTATATASHSATTATHTEADTTATFTRDTAATHSESHAEKVKEPTPVAQPLRVRFRWLLLGIVAGLVIVGWRRYKQFADHEYWQ